MTYEEAKVEGEKCRVPDEEGDVPFPLFVRAGREGLALHEYPRGTFWWFRGVSLVGLPADDQRLPCTQEDFDADDWDFVPYYP
ncbi:MAG: hypothetical protein ACO1SV_10285 [Fimbriimonas sp.]